MASPSRNKVRVEVARQLREARATHAGRVELYETDPRKANLVTVRVRVRVRVSVRDRPAQGEPGYG